MLGSENAKATIAVKDLDVARKFYEETLGLKLVDAEGSEALTFESGSSKILVYRSQFAGTNKATSVTWMVGGKLDEIVRELKGKGVRFEKFEVPGGNWEGDVLVGGNLRNAWLKDPDGNFLSIVSG